MAVAVCFRSNIMTSCITLALIWITVNLGAQSPWILTGMESGENV